MIYRADNNLKRKLVSFFQDNNDKIILSCIQGHMGEAWVDNLINPSMAQLIIGDFIFFAGDSTEDAADELLRNLPSESLVVVSDDNWKQSLERIHKGNFQIIKRYAFEKRPEHLKPNHIKTLLEKLPKAYELKRIDRDIANSQALRELSEDFTSQFDSIDDYINRGVGFCILYEGRVVSGASSYSIFDDGIEIEVDTHPEHRKKGLATVAAAALILYCLKNGLYPSWDAANLISVALAQKLGYVLDKPYDTYYVSV